MSRSASSALMAGFDRSVLAAQLQALADACSTESVYCRNIISGCVGSKKSLPLPITFCGPKRCTECSGKEALECRMASECLEMLLARAGWGCA
ncbi:hypothetical protein ABPG75_002148 [Micractinium tetrahymenae]